MSSQSSSQNPNRRTSCLILVIGLPVLFIMVCVLILWPAFTQDWKTFVCGPEIANNYSDWEIMTIEADSGDSHEQNLTHSPDFEDAPQWSLDGSQIAYRSDRDGFFDIYMMNVDGSHSTRLTQSSDPELSFDWAPDGDWITFSVSTTDWTKSHIGIMHTDGTDRTLLTSGEVTDTTPMWLSDGSHIGFLRTQENGNPNIYLMSLPPDPLSEEPDVIPLTDTSDKKDHLAWSPDGNQVVFAAWPDNKSSSDLYIVNTDGTNLTALTSTPYSEALPAWSPDGRQIAYNVYEGEREDIYRDTPHEIYIMNLDMSKSPKLLVSGTLPTWSPDGTRLAFLTNSKQIAVINPDGSNLQQLTNASGYNRWDLSWSPDGQVIVYNRLHNLCYFLLGDY